MINHQLVFYKDKFYDPSYGVSYDSETELSEKAIEAFYKEVYVKKSERDLDLDFNGDSVYSSEKENYPIYLIKKNPLGLQIKVLYSNY